MYSKIRDFLEMVIDMIMPLMIAVAPTGMLMLAVMHENATVVNITAVVVFAVEGIGFISLLVYGILEYGILGKEL